MTVLRGHWSLCTWSDWSLHYIGILGAASATLISFAIAGVLTVRVSFRYLKFEIGWSFILKSITASFIMSLVIWKLNPIGTLNVLISIGVGVVVYFMTLVLLKGIKREEVGFIKNILRM